ncbi:TPA: Cyclin-dependent kinase inhibitor 3 [Trebouxia sp. C0006]
MTPDMPLRTSASHPITLSGIFAWQGGSLGLCFCPGKCVSRDGVRYKRSLQQDLKHLQERYGITGLVCLLNTAELRSFGLREYAASVDKAGLVLLSFPIIEMAAPTCIHQTHRIVQQTAQLMAEGHHIAVHCRYTQGHHYALSPSRSCLVMLTRP